MSKKSTPTAPAAPDPVMTTQAQTASNIQTAEAQAALNRINQYTPYGSSVYTAKPTSSFDQAGYDKAMADYNKQLGTYNAGGNVSNPTAGPVMIQSGADLQKYLANTNNARGTAPIAPTRDQFTKQGIPQYSNTVTLNPQDQALLDQERAINGQLYGIGQEQLGRIQKNFGQELNFDNLPDPMALAGEGSRKPVEDAMYARATSRLDPQFQQQEDSMRTQLINQGVIQGSKAWDNAMNQFGQTKNDAYAAALNDAIAAGGSEQSRLFGLTSTARQQAIQEEMLKRQTPLNELTALTSGGQVGMPQFGNTPQVGVNGTDVQGAYNTQYQGALNNYNQQVASQNAKLGAIAGMAGTIGSAAIKCARHFKENGRPVSEILPRIEKLTVEAWDYKPGVEDSATHIGPYADEFKELFGVGDGITISAVDAFGVCLLGIKELSQHVQHLESRIC